MSDLRVETLDEFVAVDETGAEALLGHSDAALIPEGGDVMIYGDGGAGKTTLCVDLACHLAAGDDWLGIGIPRPVRVLVIENEGPRPYFRTKLRRKRDAWTGSPLEDRLHVVAEPWAVLTLVDEVDRMELAGLIDKYAIDIVILGPVTRTGMDTAGTLQEVRDFTAYLASVRSFTERIVAFVLVHHENKGGQVSGAWEGAVDTLLHVQGQGHGQTRVFVQKARWSSSHHATSLHLAWTDGEGFELVDKPEVTEDTITVELLTAVGANGGASWTKIRESVRGNATLAATVRDRLLAAGQIVNTAAREGQFRLWLPDDPASSRSGLGTGLERLSFPTPDGAAEGVPFHRSPYKGNGVGNGTAEPGSNTAETLTPEAIAAIGKLPLNVLHEMHLNGAF